MHAIRGADRLCTIINRDKVSAELRGFVVGTEVEKWSLKAHPLDDWSATPRSGSDAGS
jgi:hypothetical protein